MRLPILALAFVALLSGCANAAQRPSFAEPGPSTTSATSPAQQSPKPSGSAHTQPVVTRDGPCPYFATELAMQTIGQHLSRSTVTSAAPYPGCALYRPDGAVAIRIQPRVVASAAQAQERAVTGLGANANPVAGVGDRGTVLIVPDGARLLVSKGSVLVDIWINQQSSLQARDLATAALKAIH